ncbi:MAG: hypothetical protein KGM44_10755 [bacterium]|nr:hypothetical protein [bacterium]
MLPWPELAALAGIALIGVATLNYPFAGDQALFAVGAAKLHAGGLLYRDFWDLKQPGIYLFYLAAGSLFGFSEFGVHLLELLVLLGFSVLLQRVLSSYLASRWASAAAPLMIVGSYYAIGTEPTFTQVEMLAGVALFVTLWLAVTGNASRGARRVWYLLAAGIAGAAVLLLKLMYLPVVLAIWSVVLLAGDRDAKLPRSAWPSTIAALLAGLLLPLLALWAAFAPHIGARLLSETFFVYPPEIVARLPHPSIARLFYSGYWFVGYFAPIVLLGTLAFVAEWRRPRPFSLALVVWIVFGSITIALQRQSWWPYQFLLLLVPFGILAASGVERLLASSAAEPARGQLANRRVILVTGLALAFSLIGVKAAAKIEGFSRSGFDLTRADRSAYQFRTSSGYRQARDETAFLNGPLTRRGAIYVIGDPIYYRFAHREQAISLNGWAPMMLLPEQWLSLRDELRRHRPVYIFIESEYQGIVDERSPELLAFLRSHYDVLTHDAAGTWWAAR